MQIFVHPIIGPDGIKEWTMIELQGDLESRNLNGLRGLIGDLHYGKDNAPILIIGHHILYGKIQKIEKPFAVLEKRRTVDGEGTEYVVGSVIRKKLIFKDRPKPIVTLNNSV